MKNRYQFYAITVSFFLIFSSYKNKKTENSNSLPKENKSELYAISSDDCKGYYPLNKGVSFELTSYDKKDKADAIINYKIIESKEIDNGVIATCKMNVSDLDGNPGFEMSYEAKCQNGNYYLNLETIFSELTSQYESNGMKISIENGTSIIPNNLSVNDKLEDAIMNMNISSTAMNMTTTIAISDRVIIGKETITTPAGTFDCIILSQKVTTKMGKLMTITTNSKDWLSKGIGSVKSENYNKKGKLKGYTLLTKFSE